MRFALSALLSQPCPQLPEAWLTSWCGTVCLLIVAPYLWPDEQTVREAGMLIAHHKLRLPPAREEGSMRWRGVKLGALLLNRRVLPSSNRHAGFREAFLPGSGANRLLFSDICPSSSPDFLSYPLTSSLPSPVVISPTSLSSHPRFHRLSPGSCL